MFFPIGFDAFGLPAENAAIKSGGHPFTWTMPNIENMRRQFRTMGATFSWEHEVVTADPSYYRWNQWMFLRFLEAASRIGQVAGGLVPQRRDAGARTGRGRGPPLLALRRSRSRNATSSSGTCARPPMPTSCCDFDGIDWPEPIRIQQTNWIGRSEGAEIDFETAPSDHHPGGETLRVFTTRPDTLFGATFMVLAPEHPLVADPDRARDERAEVDAYVEQARRRTEIDRLSTDREKTGVAIGADAINPVNGERIPIFIADYVLSGYGTGAIMAVPAHDERDFAFAQQFGLPIRRVVAAPGTEADDADGRRLHRPRRRRAPGQQRPSSMGMLADEGGKAIVANSPTAAPPSPRSSTDCATG